MYVVTFYSFKGGVGRTMALVNVAVALARARRRVLVVDFDLEAPGLPSYQAFKGADCSRGVVDYVSSYRATGQAPLVSEFITECNIDDAPIWLMSAGDHCSQKYSQLLHSIDWQDLYEHQEGFLMFEDLKAQWAAFDGKGFDYVLIDSRTGHTDVGGICTRQLPDSVVVMFVPNEQNIDGLVPVVRTIRAERKSRRKPVNLLFCPSNVPDLDDENDILKFYLHEASKKLNYAEPAAMIKSYQSLEVLTQSAFTQSRPNSQLAKNYEKLKTAIIANNYDDYDGAIAALQLMPANLDLARRRGDSESFQDIRKAAIDISERHTRDGKVAHLAAKVFKKIGDPTQEIDALDTAIEAGHEVARNLLSRAVLHLVSSDKVRAKADLLQIINSAGATIFDLVPALEIAQRIDNFWIEAVQKALNQPSEEFSKILALCTFITTRTEALPLIAETMERFAMSNDLSEKERQRARNEQILNLIGMKEFDRAMSVLAPDGEAPIVADAVDKIFNYAIAKWGASGQMPKELFEILATKFPTENPKVYTANWHQCFALSLAAIGQREQAIVELEKAASKNPPGGMEFSCWTYLRRSRADMADDIKSMREQFQAKGPIRPSLFERVPVTYQ